MCAGIDRLIDNDGIISLRENLCWQISKYSLLNSNSLFFSFLYIREHHALIAQQATTVRTLPTPLRSAPMGPTPQPEMTPAPPARLVCHASTQQRHLLLVTADTSVQRWVFNSVLIDFYKTNYEKKTIMYCYYGGKEWMAEKVFEK